MANHSVWECGRALDFSRFSKLELPEMLIETKEEYAIEL